MNFSKIWSTDYQDSGVLQTGSFWQVNCPKGYGALSDLCQHGDSEPSISQVSCIREDYLEDDLHDDRIWSSSMSGAAVLVKLRGGKTDLTEALLGATTNEGGKRSGLKKIKSDLIGILD